MPLCVEDFLDIIDNCGRSYSHSIQKNHLDEKPLPYTYTSPSKKDRHKNRKHVHYPTAACAKDHVSDLDHTNVVNDILNNRQESRKMTHVLYTTFIITTLVYIISILIGIVDIEGTTYGKHKIGFLLVSGDIVAVRLI